MANEARDAPREMANAGEEILQAKAAEISGGKRAVPTQEVRQAAANAFVLDELIEWVATDGSGRYIESQLSVQLWSLGLNRLSSIWSMSLTSLK